MQIPHDLTLWSYGCWFCTRSSWSWRDFSRFAHKICVINDFLRPILSLHGHVRVQFLILHRVTLAVFQTPHCVACCPSARVGCGGLGRSGVPWTDDRTHFVGFEAVIGISLWMEKGQLVPNSLLSSIMEMHILLRACNEYMLLLCVQFI